MSPDEPNEEERLEQLPEDGQTPFSPADDSRDPDSEPDDERQAEENKFDDTHPLTDSGMEAGEIYGLGTTEAAGMKEPNAGNTVISYHPPDEPRDDPQKTTS